MGTGQLVFNRGDVATPLDAINAMCPARFVPSTETDWHKVWLAGEMLLLIGLPNVENDEVGREVLPHIRDLLARLVSEGCLEPMERATAANILSQLDDPRFGIGILVNGLPDIDWVNIPAGPFLMGCDKGTGPNAHDSYVPQRTVYLENYYISRYPITNIQFQAFVSAPDYDDDVWWAGMPEKRDDGLGTTYFIRDMSKQDFKYSNHPFETDMWYLAVAFTRWLSDKLEYEVRLPTEQEWEKAARGTDGRKYPYGDIFDVTKANTSEIGINGMSAVGIFPDGASPYGVHDMTGNVWEWCLNKYEDPEQIDVDDSEDTRVLRGGSWNYNFDLDTRGPIRPRWKPFFPGGFRLVRPSIL